ncbi:MULTISPECIES: putative T7SS-secreted protein [unclassified Streptomyces]|uniref:putative T7SS-secreted protein n=1 Tax=Streptomyces TaxID=1883 RepID=UPI00164E5D09|nr:MULTISPECIES: hypothetical protein [unclassified Streptomyces]MCZ4096371.1 hypothetical protein [Streptomyces sp. H39-C1]
MTRPSYGWEVLGEHGDPVPGDPDTVARLGRELRKTAESIEREAREIKALASVEAWKGKAADEFRDQASKASDKLRKAFHRYDEAAKALGEDAGDGVTGGPYARELHRAQKIADKALRDAQDADTEHSGAQRAISQQPADTPKDDPTAVKLKAKQDAAAGAIGEAKKDLQRAKDIRDHAAKAAADAIRHAIDHDGLKDSRWDKFKGWVHEHADIIGKIADIAGWVATICGTLSLLVGWIPIIGQALAGILGTIALVATLVSLVAHVLLALSGDGNWFDVALDVVGLATFGIGRGAIAGARGASAGTRALARSARYKSIMESAVANGLKKGTKAYQKQVAKAWKIANRESGGAARGKDAANAMKNAPKGWFPGWGRVGDAVNPVKIAKESWQSVKDLKAFRDVPQLFHGNTWTGVRAAVGDTGLATDAANLARANVGNIANGAVHAGADVFKTQTRIWIGATGIASGIDAADKAGAGDALGLKDSTVREIGD